MPSRIRPVCALTAVASLVLLSGCSRTPVDATPAGLASSPACTKAAAAWPKTVGAAHDYPVSTKSTTVRAWGSTTSNAIIARCGVDSPGPTTDACLQVDDVDWVQTAVTGGYRFITYGRTPAIEVLVPKAASDTPGMLLPAFTGAAHAVPQGSHHCQ